MAKGDDSDSDENEQIRRSGRQRKRAKNVPQTQMYSSSEDEGSDGDYGGSKRGKAKTQSSSQKKIEKKSATETNEASEEGEVASSSESDDSGSSSGSSDDSSSESTDNDADTSNEMSRLVADEEDKKRLMSMTEREREEELFQRLQRKTMIEKRRELERKLKQKTSTHASNDDKAGSSSQRRHSSRKEKVSKGLEDLKSERKAKKDKEAKRHADTRKRKGRDTASSDAESGGGSKSVKRERVHARDVYGSDEDDANVDIDGVIGLKPIPRTKVASGEGDEMGGADSRGGAGGDDEEDNAPETIKIEQLRQAQVFRRELADWLYAPFLRQFLIGVYVRINVGTHPDRNEPVYRIGQIEDIIEATDRTYEIEGQRTNKYLKLKLGSRSREFRISYVSNSDITAEEFQMWLNVLHHFHLPLVSSSEISLREHQLTEARCYHFTNDELNKMLEAKKAMNANCLNPATGKAQLRLELQRLYDRGAPQAEIDALLKQIRVIDDIISRREKSVSSNSLTILGKVSQRNKFQNIETAMRLANPAAAAHADRQKLLQLQQQQQRFFMPPPLGAGVGVNNNGIPVHIMPPLGNDDDDEGDPFTRRRTTPQMFFGAKARGSAANLNGMPIIKQEQLDSKDHLLLLPKLEQQQQSYAGSISVKIEAEAATNAELAAVNMPKVKFELREDEVRDVKPDIAKLTSSWAPPSGPKDEFLDLFDVEVGDLDII